MLDVYYANDVWKSLYRKNTINADKRCKKTVMVVADRGYKLNYR